jgi:hypothetical protein
MTLRSLGLEYRNKKTGDLYLVHFNAMDATNTRDGQMVVVYTPKDDYSQIFVRNATEFDEKFELLKIPLPKCDSCNRLIHEGPCS